MSRVSVLLLVVLVSDDDDDDDDDEFVGVRGGVTPGECVDILSIAVVAFIFAISRSAPACLWMRSVSGYLMTYLA
jgi:hypothetical protein